MCMLWLDIQYKPHDIIVVILNREEQHDFHDSQWLQK